MADTENEVDLDVLTGASTTYKLPDVAGVEHRFSVPNDIPFPTAVVFMRAAEQLEAMTRTESVDDYEAVFSSLVASFVPILQLRQPDMDLEEFQTRFGQGYILRMVTEVMARLNAAAVQASPKAGNRQERRQGQKAKPQTAKPRTRASSASSAGSDAPTAGRTTTGAP